MALRNRIVVISSLIQLFLLTESSVYSQIIYLTLADGPLPQPYSFVIADYYSGALREISHEGIAIAVETDQFGNAFVLRITEPLVRKYSPEGWIIDSFSTPPGGGGFPIFLAYDGTDSLYVKGIRLGGSRDRTYLQRFNSNGTDHGELDASFAQGVLAVDRSGNLVTAYGNKIRVLQPDGGLIREIEWSSDSRESVSGVDVEEDGSYLIVSRRYQNSGPSLPERVFHFDSFTGLSTLILDAATLGGDILTAAKSGMNGEILVSGGPADYTAGGFIKRFDRDARFLGDLLFDLPGTPGDFALAYPVPEPLDYSLCLPLFWAFASLQRIRLDPARWKLEETLGEGSKNTGSN